MTDYKTDDSEKPDFEETFGFIFASKEEMEKRFKEVREQQRDCDHEWELYTTHYPKEGVCGSYLKGYYNCNKCNKHAKLNDPTVQLGLHKIFE